jgi:hypothetical protein
MEASAQVESAHQPDDVTVFLILTKVSVNRRPDQTRTFCHPFVSMRQFFLQKDGPSFLIINFASLFLMISLTWLQTSFLHPQSGVS